jgi:predicted Zn finger-like uncharacterized protein
VTGSPSENEALMKIVCDSCGTKYSISDDKVRGKVFKIRCKKCSHIIVVRGNNEAAAASPAAAAPADAAVAGGWHLVVDGEQVGPVPESDIRARIERGEINAETYVWKEGFADWLKLSAIPEFASLVTPAEGGVFADGTGSGAVNGEAAHQLAAEPAASGGGGGSGGGGLFGGAPASDEADVFGGLAPAASKRSGGGDLFASPAVAAKPASDEARWPAAAAAPAGHDGGRVENLTGQRHENSVLFSLSNLQSLATAPAAAKPLSTTAPTSEGSGLIDIRAMAATTLGGPSSAGPSFGSSSNGGDDLPAFGAFSPAAPVLLALPTQSGPSKWVYAGIGVAALLFIAVGVMAFKVMTAKPAAQAEVATAPAAAPGAPAPAAAPSAPVAVAPAAAPTTIPDEKLPPREAPKAEPEKAAKSEKAEKSDHHHGKDHGGKEAKKGAAEESKGASKAVAEAPAAPAPVAEKKPAKGSLDDLLEGALNHKSGGSSAPRVQEDAPRKAEPAGGGPLSKSAVVAGMNSVKGKISDCYQQFKVPGMAMVNVVIGKNGHVSSASVTGKFAGTPTGSCVEKAVKSASFPPSDGLSTPYPFQLK